MVFIEMVFAALMSITNMYSASLQQQTLDQYIMQLASCHKQHT
jgi:hypothetical protein